MWSVFVRLGSLIGPTKTASRLMVTMLNSVTEVQLRSYGVEGVAIYVHHDIVCQPVACEANSETINICAVTIGCKDGPLPYCVCI